MQHAVEARLDLSKEKAMRITSSARTTKSRIVRSAVILAIGTLVTAGLGGCNNGGEGALSGAALGGLVGFGLGSLSGDAGKGAAAGALLGGLGGAVLGDQNRRNSGY
mgnify:CR=1 FL=1